MKKRFKNYAFLVSFISQIIIVVQLGLKLFLDYDLSETLKEEILGFANAILVVLSFMGIINNPTTKNKWFKDDENKV